MQDLKLDTVDYILLLFVLKTFRIFEPPPFVDKLPTTTVFRQYKGHVASAAEWVEFDS